MAALRHAGAVRCGDGCPYQARRRTAGALQRLRAYRVEPLCAALPVGQQPAGLCGRADRQLCVLYGGRLGEERRDVRRGRRDVRGSGRAGVAQRPHLLQYGLSGRHATGLRVAFCGLQAAHRHLEVQRLRALRAQLQGLVHRRQVARNRLQPLCGLHGLYRQMPSARHRLFAQTGRKTRFGDLRVRSSGGSGKDGPRRCSGIFVKGGP